jgi:hypothetical protein
MSQFHKCSMCAADTEFEQDGARAAYYLCQDCEAVQVIICGNNEVLRNSVAPMAEDGDRQDAADVWFEAAIKHLNDNLPFGKTPVVSCDFAAWNGGTHYREGAIHADYWHASQNDQLESCIEAAMAAGNAAVNEFIGTRRVDAED